MKPKQAPWNTNNQNVLILAGKHYEEFALKFGVCISKNEIELIPCRYIAIYSNDTISYLFEIIKPPIDNATIDNTEEIKNIHQLEKKRAAEWQGDNNVCRMFIIKKVADVGPVINDFISPITKKPTPMTCGSPRYTTYARIREAKLTSDLKCVFDDDCPPTEDEVIAVAPPPQKKKRNYAIPVIIALFSIALISIIAYFLLKEPEIIVETQIIREIEPPKIVLPYLYFDTGKFDLLNKHILVLDEVYRELSPLMAKFDNMEISIVGYADARGSEKTNIELSEKRAENIRNWLVNKGLDSNRIYFAGKGVILSDSLAKQTSIDQNRRIEFKVTYK